MDSHHNGLSTLTCVDHIYVGNDVSDERDNIIKATKNNMLYGTLLVKGNQRNHHDN